MAEITKGANVCELNAVSGRQRFLFMSFTGRTTLAEMALDKVKWSYTLLGKLPLFCVLIVPVMEPMSRR